MKVRCDCGSFHDVSPTGMALVIQAFQDGDMQNINGKEGIYSRCLMDAFTERRMQLISTRYPSNTISIAEYRERKGSHGAA